MALTSSECERSRLSITIGLPDALSTADGTVLSTIDVVSWARFVTPENQGHLKDWSDTAGDASDRLAIADLGPRRGHLPRIDRQRARHLHARRRHCRAAVHRRLVRLLWFAR